MKDNELKKRLIDIHKKMVFSTIFHIEDEGAAHTEYKRLARLSKPTQLLDVIEGMVNFLEDEIKATIKRTVEEKTEEERRRLWREMGLTKKERLRYLRFMREEGKNLAIIAIADLFDDDKKEMLQQIVSPDKEKETSS